METHPECWPDNPNQRTSPSDFFPTLFLDIGSENDADFPFLFTPAEWLLGNAPDQRAPGSSYVPRHVTLSYCWGDANSNVMIATKEKLRREKRVLQFQGCRRLSEMLLLLLRSWEFDILGLTLCVSSKKTQQIGIENVGKWPMCICTDFAQSPQPVPPACSLVVLLTELVYLNQERTDLDTNPLTSLKQIPAIPAIHIQPSMARSSHNPIKQTSLGFAARPLNPHPPLDKGSSRQMRSEKKPPISSLTAFPLTQESSKASFSSH